MRRAPVSAFMVGLLLLALWSCASAPHVAAGAQGEPTSPGGAPPGEGLPEAAAPDISGTVDFAALHRFSLLYSVMRYQSDAQIHAT